MVDTFYEKLYSCHDIGIRFDCAQLAVLQVAVVAGVITHGFFHLWVISKQTALAVERKQEV